jgi:hypothetical protein
LPNRRPPLGVGSPPLLLSGRRQRPGRCRPKRDWSRSRRATAWDYRSTPNPLQGATEIEAAGNPENQVRTTRGRFRSTSRVWGVNRQAYGAWLLFSSAYILKDRHSRLCQTSLAFYLRLKSRSPKRSTARRNYPISKSVDLARGLSSPLLCAPACRPAHLLVCSASPHLAACPAARSARRRLVRLPSCLLWGTT